MPTTTSEEATAISRRMSEKEMVRGLQNGDRLAWLAVYDQNHQIVWRYVARLIGTSQSEIADVVQETFLRAAESAGNFDASKGTIPRWLLGIAHHGVSEYWKNAKQQKKIIATRAEQITERERVRDASLAEEPSLNAEDSSELTTHVRATLASLSSEYADLLLAKYVERMSVQAIVESRGGSIEAVRSKIARARRAFRKAFQCRATSG